jgi:hypothetical protein
MWAKTMVMVRRARVEKRLSALAACVALAACAHGGDLGTPGVSDAPVEAPRRPPTTEVAPREPWALSGDAQSFAAIDDRELPSGHNAPYWSGVVRVSPALEPLYAAMGPSALVPPGAVAVETHRSTDGSVSPRYVMVKREAGFDVPGGDWEYLVVDAEGRIAARGALPLCARCHAEAPGDHLFGPRVSARRTVAGTPVPAGSSALPEDDEARAPEDAAVGTPGTKPPKSRKKKR